jgi:integrase
MSKPFKRNHPLHLCRSGNSFQYNRIFTEGFPSAPGIPKQIRWSLGLDFGIAARCAELLNRSFDLLVNQALEQRWHTQRVVTAIERIRAEFKETLQHIQLPLGELPSPQMLACADLAQGYERLNQACRIANPIALDTDGLYRLTLTPSTELRSRLLVDFHRFDWCLDTSEFEVACWKAAYIFQAMVELERLEIRGHLPEVRRFQVMVHALYDYLAYVRKDHGVGLHHIPMGLPQSVSELLSKPSHQENSDCKHLECLFLTQDKDGYFVLEIDLAPLSIPGPTLHLNLRTTSIIKATLAFTMVMKEVGDCLDELKLANTISVDAVASAMAEITELFCRYLDLNQGDHPLLPSPHMNPAGDPETADPKIVAAITAMANLLPASQQKSLQQLLNAPPPVYPGNELPSRALRFGQLVDEFSQQQEIEQTWTHPRTRQLNLSRLGALVEIVGADRVASTLTRAETIKIRDQIRLYPRNRNKLFGCKNAPLHQVIGKGTYTPIHPRTGKQYFELLQRVLRYGLDFELIPSDPSSGLSFNTKGAAPARRRTWSRDQLERALRGPVYTLKEQARWRMDDFKFWLPLLGAYQGARLNELCQLTAGDIRKEHDIWYMSLNDDGDDESGMAQKRLKNMQSRRNVPLHRAVLEAGFLTFVEHRKAIPGSTSASPLFGGLTSHATSHSSHTASKWFLGNGTSSGGYLQQCGLGQERLTFHGLRHTFINQARQQNLDVLVVKALVGHTDDSVTSQYGDAYSLQVLNTVLQKLDYNIDTSHIHYLNYLNLTSKKHSPKI